MNDWTNHRPASKRPLVPLTGVEKTALGMAYVRAGENQREDRLFDDPYAEAFEAAAPQAFRAGSGAPPGAVRNFVHGAVIRTRFFDDYLLAAGCSQVVLLAAGLDTRAFRLDWPDEVRLFEVDLPAVLSFKERVLAERAAVPRCERITLTADLRHNWPEALVGAGFERAVPTAWLAEGLLTYLTADDAARLFTAVGELSAPGSRIAFEHVVVTALLHKVRAMPAMSPFTALWKGGLGSDTVDWLTRHGWHAEIHDCATMAAAYGRPGPADGGLAIAQR